MWEELFDLVREGFRLCGRSDTLSVLNDPHYLGSLTAAIRRTYALPGETDQHDNTTQQIASQAASLSCSLAAAGVSGV